MKFFLQEYMKEKIFDAVWYLPYIISQPEECIVFMEIKQEMCNICVDSIFMSINIFPFFLLKYFRPISLILEVCWNIEKADYGTGKHEE